MMRNYIGTKFVQAEPEMRDQIACEGRTIMVPQGFKPTPEWITDHGLKLSDTLIRKEVEGYKVRYADGYESWSPKDAFEDAYRPIMDNMDFGMALTCMKAGMRVTRKGWFFSVQTENSFQHKVRYTLALRKGYEGITVNDDTRKAFKLMGGAKHDVAPYIQGIQDDGTLFVYIPTMEDILANDWRVMFDDDVEMDMKFGEGSSNE